ncbi:hypothetical protein [Planococcus lenghuensis]|uniref:Uncharacterized protein n=1 Tax=Planococcus lenghuensis TaxID=2213202 RepID=A0A1Q2KVS8_9BACL|nr:hypothetical protein [Planococcus lenghuensis]AQQ52325.1 hypothetical protein B0X71_03840 [Planococcus lenghuensis]
MNSQDPTKVPFPLHVNAVTAEGMRRLFDWGDAAITHPFLIVRVFWNSLAEQIGCLYRAFGWHLYINPHREDRIDSFKRPAQWLQLLLDHRKFN